jgi:lipopolysaccharide export system permease protein
MQIITKYLIKTVTTYILLVVLLLLGIQAFIEFTKEFPNIGTGNYGIWQMLAYVPLMLPSEIYQFFPMAGLLGTTLGLGLLASHSELIIMRSVGMSQLAITSGVLKAALLLTLVMVLLGEVVAPVAQRIAITNKTIALSGGQTLMTHQGVWVHKNNNYVHINRVLADQHLLEGATRYQFDANNKLVLASFAKTAKYQNGQWIFYDVTQTNFTDKALTNVYSHEQHWGFTWDPQLLGLSSVDADQKSLIELHDYIHFSHQNGMEARHYEIIFWQRIFQPLAVLVMIILAAPFVFGPLRAANTGLRLLAGVMVAFGFYIFNEFVGPLSIVYQIPPFIAALLPAILFGSVGAALLYKAK